MSESFDTYYRWLGIPPQDQPPDHYRLLGLRRLEENPDVIDNAADRQVLHLRSVQSSEHGALCEKILLEIASARECLLDPASKQTYDQQLPAPQPVPEATSAASPRQSDSPAPSAVPMAAEWYFQAMGKDFGPVRFVKLVEFVKLDRIDPFTLVKRLDGPWLMWAGTSAAHIMFSERPGVFRRSIRADSKGGSIR